MEREKTLRNRKLRATRVRKRLLGTPKRPRLSVAISNHHVSAQLIDDQNGKTLAASSSVAKKPLIKTNLSAKATWVGEDIAKQAKAVKIKAVVFDRGQRLYHGRIKALAEAARQGGLEF